MPSGLGVMFTPEGKATPLLISQWKRRGAGKPLPPSAVLLHGDGSAQTPFRALWQEAFPDDQALPFGALCDAEGRFTDPMVSRWL